MTNKEIAQILYDIADFLEIQNVPFRPRAYQKAALTVEESPTELDELYRRCGRKCVDDLPGIGESLAAKIEELILTGRMKYYESLKRKFPFDMHGLTEVENVGPKTAYKLYTALKIRNLRNLEVAARGGRIRSVRGFGKKTEDNILESLGFLKTEQGRLLLGEILPYAQHIVETLRAVEGVRRCDVAGSIRRRQETIGDIDILVTTSKPAAVIKAFKRLPEIIAVMEEGPTRVAVKYKLGVNGDLRVLKDSEYGAALLYFTGSKFHNIQLRTIAAKKGWKLSEYGLFRGHTVLASTTEQQIYRRLGMAWMPPEIRTASGEIEAAQKGAIPTLIPYGSIRGDLQVQTNWTDGRDSIETMAKAARDAGLEYIAITDHTRTLAMTGGLTESDLARQTKEIDKLNKSFKGFRILKSAEVNILKDGKLDIADEALKKLDVVSVAVHSNFGMTEDEMTARIIRALKHPLVNILFHPTGRVIKGRPPYALNMEKIIRAAKAYKVALEVDSFPDRLDLRDEHIRLAVKAGVKLVVDSDAHATEHFNFLDLGVAQCRRGWAKKSDVLNTKPVAVLLKALKKR